jgi:hypothetical protein
MSRCGMTADMRLFFCHAIKPKDKAETIKPKGFLLLFLELMA